MRQLGNAVPVELAHCVCSAVMDNLSLTKSIETELLGRPGMALSSPMACFTHDNVLYHVQLRAYLYSSLACDDERY
jgi:hypothetical protein